jgi:PAS domain S-box-containing protein
MGRQFDPEQFVRAAGDAIIAAGTDGSIVFWNPAAERMFGYTESEALGQSLDLIIPERFRHRHWDGSRPHPLDRLHRHAAADARHTSPGHRGDRPG